MNRKSILLLAIFVLLVGIGTALNAQEKEVKYVGSSQSKKYHFVECKWAKKIAPENLVSFKSVAEAKKAAYKPCKVCKPPERDKQ